MIYDRLPDVPLIQRCAQAARDWCIENVEAHTGPMFGVGRADAWMPAELEDFGVVLAPRFGLKIPKSCIVHRDLQIPEHTDDRVMPYAATNLAVFWRSTGVTGGDLFFPYVPLTLSDDGAIRGYATEPFDDAEYACTNDTVAVFDGTQPHGIRPFEVPPGGYRITVTYYAPKE